MRIEVCRCLDVMPNVDATFRMLCFENSSRIVENREPILVLVSCVFFFVQHEVLRWIFI